MVSDFGRKDPYAGVMAGSALSAAPGIRLVEVTHEVPAFNVRHGAWIVGQVVDAFPPGATILAVVDPGVGSSRLPVAVQCRERWLVGPDNGLLTRHPPDRAWALRWPELPGWRVRAGTFHGRDLFAPAAARLAAGAAPGELGVEIDPSGLARLLWPSPRERAGELIGEILLFDHYGNAITNLPGEVLEGCRVVAGGAELLVVDHYAAAEPGAAVALIGSHGAVELAVVSGSYEGVAGAREGDPVSLAPPGP